MASAAVSTYEILPSILSTQNNEGVESNIAANAVTWTLGVAGPIVDLLNFPSLMVWSQTGRFAKIPWHLSILFQGILE